MDNGGWQGYQLPEPAEAGSAARGIRGGLRPVWIVAGALAMAAVGMVTVALLRPPAAPTGNPGVVAAKQYLTEYQAAQEEMAGPVAVALGERLMAEPFEMDMDMTVTSDALPQMGMPMKRLVMGMEVKYDLNDLGMKLRMLGMEYGIVYLIGDELVIGTPQGVYSLPVSVPDDVDLSRSMGLGERVSYLLPVPVVGEGISDGLADVLARSVPDEYTRVYTDSVYSPLDGRDAEMTVIETSLDRAALETVAANADTLLQEDMALREELDALLGQAAQLGEMEWGSLDDLLAGLKDGSVMSSEGDALTWQVYQRQGRYVGLAVQLTLNGEDALEWRMMSELKGRESHEALSVMRNGELIQSMNYTVVYEENHTKMDGTIFVGEGQIMDIATDIEMQKNGDIYNLKCVIDMEGDASGMLPGSFNVIIDADIRVDEDLKTLREDSAWSDVYGEEWERLDGTLQDLIMPRM